jgi:L-gulonolactone oxidase
MSVAALQAAYDNLRATPTSVPVAETFYKTVLEASPDDLDKVRLLSRSVPPGWHWNNLRMDHMPALITAPHSEADLLKVLANSRRAKAIGNGWGFSTAGQTEGSLIPMINVAQDERVIDIGVLTHEAATRVSTLCQFDAGTTIRTLNRVLDERGLALWNAPGFNELTFVGAMSSGGHGSGTWLGPLAEQVRSLGMLTLGRDSAERRVRVEPANGITDPANFKAKYGASVELIQSDERFRACVVGIGALGVITDATIEVRSAYRLEEQRVLLPWNKVRTQLLGYLRDQGPKSKDKLHSIEIWLNPYPIAGQVMCVLGTKRWSTAKPHGHRGFGVLHASAEAFAFLSWFMATLPISIPALLHVGLSLTTSGKVVMPSCKALDFGKPNKARVIPAAVGVAINKQLPDVISSLIQFLQDHLSFEGASVTSPVGLRFVGPSSAWLAPQHNQSTCMIEMPILEGTPAAEETLKAFHEWARTYNGRPHWGQRHWTKSEDLRRMYRDSIAAFNDAHNDLNPDHLFDNKFTEDLEFGHPAPSATLFRQAAAPSSMRRTMHRSWSRLFYDDSAQNSLPLPTTEANVVAMMKHAKAEHVKLVLRAGGNALHTQSLGMSSVEHSYLATDQGGAIDIAPDATGGWRVRVGGGVRWGRLIAATLERGLVPRVVVTTPHATVGGTLSSNSIGQASRRFGHESDGVVSITIVVPNGKGVEPQAMTIARPAPGATGPDAELFRAAVGGYGLIGVIIEATYELVPVPSHARAVTHITAFDAERHMEDALKALDGSAGDDGLFKSCTLFLSSKGWRAGVVATSFDAHDDTSSHMLPYAGKTPIRWGSEFLLTFMGTAYFAHQLAADFIDNASIKRTEYVDQVRDFLFLMEPNHDFKKGRSDFVAGTVQQTFVLPSVSAARQFIDHAFAKLRDPIDIEAIDEHEFEALVDGNPEEVAALAEIEKNARQVEGRFSETADSTVELARALLHRLSKRPRILPALFEMVWVREDDHLLSATHGQAGFAISLTFQGPGVTEPGFLAGLFKKRHAAIFATLRSLATKCRDLGGRIHLTKNVFVEKPEKKFVSDMLGERLDQFNALRRLYDPLGVLTSRFAVELLDKPAVKRGSRTPAPSNARSAPAAQSPRRASRPRSGKPRP